MPLCIYFGATVYDVLVSVVFVLLDRFGAVVYRTFRRPLCIYHVSVTIVHIAGIFFKLKTSFIKS